MIDQIWPTCSLPLHSHLGGAFKPSCLDMAKGLAEALAGVGVLGRTMLWLAGLSTWNGADTLAWAPVASETDTQRGPCLGIGPFRGSWSSACKSSLYVWFSKTSWSWSTDWVILLLNWLHCSQECLGWRSAQQIPQWSAVCFSNDSRV